jgi:signal recognition particle subunit SRP54
VGVTERPVMFASTGEGLADFELFHPDRMASRILDMGDVLTLIEQAERAIDAEQAQKMAAKFAADEDFTLEDFLAQMAMLRNMGSLKKMIGMLPGMGELRGQLDSFDEREMDRVEAIIRSMTPQERRSPRIFNASRRLRVACGSGVEVSDVNQLLNRFDEARKVMRQMRHGGLPSTPGMPPMGGIPGLGGGSKKARGRSSQSARKQKGKSGKGAARAQQQREAAQRTGPAAGQPPPGGAFGLGQGGDGSGTDPRDLRLPPGFEKFLGR